MTKTRPIARPSGAAGVKQLITAASLAATVAGWALLTPREQPAPAVAEVAPLALAAAAAGLTPPLVPTLAPVATAAAASLAEPPVAQAAPPAAPVAAAQAPAAPVAAPALREVAAPPAAPAPVTSTRSSR